MLSHWCGVWWMATKSSTDLNKEYRENLQKEFARINDRLDGLHEKLNNLLASDISRLNARLAVVEVKAGVWGLIAGAIPAIGAMIYMVSTK